LEWLDKVYQTYVGRKKITKETGDKFYLDVQEKCKDEMEFIKSKQVISFHDYFLKWDTQKIFAEERSKKVI
jgi:hypothetical protein